MIRGLPKGLLLIVALISLIAGGFFYYFRPFGTNLQVRVMAKAVTKDGTELYVTQKATGFLTEPFEISFFTKRQSKLWQWYYIDHQSLYWSHASIDVDVTNNKALVFHGKNKIAEFDLNTDQFRLLNTGRPAAGPVEIKGTPFD